MHRIVENRMTGLSESVIQVPQPHADSPHGGLGVPGQELPALPTIEITDCKFFMVFGE